MANRLALIFAGCAPALRLFSCWTRLRRFSLLLAALHPCTVNDRIISFLMTSTPCYEALQSYAGSTFGRCTHPPPPPYPHDYFILLRFIYSFLTIPFNSLFFFNKKRYQRCRGGFPCLAGSKRCMDYNHPHYDGGFVNRRCSGLHHSLSQPNHNLVVAHHSTSL